MSETLYDNGGLIYALEGIAGWLSLEEADLLFELASQCHFDDNIVEIGSFHGRSTIALALGSQGTGANVYAIDPHHPHTTGGIDFGEVDNVTFMQNILKSNVADIVRVINFPSVDFAAAWHEPIALLFIDGDHEGDAPFMDYTFYSLYVKVANGKIAIHDSQGGWEKPTELIQNVVASGQGKIVRVVNQITVLELL